MPKIRRITYFKAVSKLSQAIADSTHQIPEIAFIVHHQDGARIVPGDVIANISGPARGILTAERVALNFLGHLSGIATATAGIADTISHTRAKICCTRKTTPGLRFAEKYAVRAGGGANHRFGLDDAVLIKDNHIAIAGGIAIAIASSGNYLAGRRLEEASHADDRA